MKDARAEDAKRMIERTEEKDAKQKIEDAKKKIGHARKNADVNRGPPKAEDASRAGRGRRLLARPG